MNAHAFADAARPTRRVILRLLMRDYSIAHELVLLRLRTQSHPRLAGIFQRPAAPSSTAHGHHPGGGRVQPDLARIEFNPAVLASKNGGRQKSGANGKHHSAGLREKDWSQAVTDFQEYRTAGSLFPRAPDAEAKWAIASGKTEAEGSSGRAMGSPFIAGLVAFAAKNRLHVHFGVETAFDVPLGFANYVYCADLERDGRICVENQLEAQARQEMEQHRADVAREQAQAGKGGG